MDSNDHHIMFIQVIQAVLRHVNFDVVKAVLIASPGFVRQQFFDYMYQQVSGSLGGVGWLRACTGVFGDFA